MMNSIIPFLAQIQVNSIGDLETLIGKGCGILYPYFFVAGLIAIVGGFIQGRRDGEWKMGVFTGLGILGSGALACILYNIFTGHTMAITF
jgi:hypothetical protein